MSLTTSVDAVASDAPRPERRRVQRAQRSGHVVSGTSAVLRQYGEKYVGKTVAWCYDVARVGDVEFKGKRGLDPKQEEILDATDRYTHVAVAGAKGVGKDFLAALKGCAFVAQRPYSLVPCASVSGGQMRGALWVRTQEVISRSPIMRQLFAWSYNQVAARGVGREDRIPLGPRWRMYLTAAAVRKGGRDGGMEAESGAGAHADNLLLILTEASGWTTPLWRARMDTLTGAYNCAYVNGNPLRSGGPFFDIYHRPMIMQDWARFHIRADEARAVEPLSVQRMINTYGETSAYVQANVYGQFPTSGSDRSIFSHKDVSAAFERDVADDFEKDLTIGCDVARFGFDRTVTHTRRDLYSLEEAWMPKSSIPETALLNITQAYRWFKRPAYVEVETRPGVWEADSGARAITRFMSIEEATAVIDNDPDVAGIKQHTVIVVDDSGVGGGVTDLLRLWGWRVVPMINNWAARQPQYYANRGAEMWMVDMKAAIAGCRLPYSDELLSQLTEREYRFTGKKEQRTLLSKEQMKAAGIDSPDHADAAVLAYADVEARDWSNPRTFVRRIG